MPELPDVEMHRRFLEETALGKRIEAVEVERVDILRGTSESEIKKTLMGERISSTERIGKYLFASLHGGRWLVFHFGMDGSFAYFVNQESRPDYSHFVLTFSDGSHLAYVSRRRLGGIWIADDIRTFTSEKNLGPDAADPNLTLEVFEETIRQRDGMAKYVLMDQHFISGVGNIYADEILFQAEVNPRIRISELDDVKLRRLFEVMRQVLQTAIDLGADSRCFPNSWIIHSRYPGARCPRCGGEISRTKIGGRGTYYCPACQAA